MNLLVNAYTCCPNMGSEQGMGWHWITGLARYCNLYIISEGEYRLQVEAWMAEPQNQVLAKNMHFHWNPVSEKVRKRCWRQGNWLFYFSYERWQRKTEQIAYQIIEKEHIDILHQLNMTGFREPGYLWRVSQKTGIRRWQVKIEDITVVADEDRIWEMQHLGCNNYVIVTINDKDYTSYKK